MPADRSSAKLAANKNMFPVAIVATSIIFAGVVLRVFARRLSARTVAIAFGVGIALYAFVALVSLPVSFLPYGSAAAVLIEESGKFGVVRLEKTRVISIASIMWFAVAEMLTIKMGINYFVLEASQVALDSHFIYYALAAILPAVMHLVTAFIYRLPFSGIALFGVGTSLHYIFNGVVNPIDTYSQSHAILLGALLVAMCVLLLCLDRSEKLRGLR